MQNQIVVEIELHEAQLREFRKLVKRQKIQNLPDTIQNIKNFYEFSFFFKVNKKSYFEFNIYSIRFQFQKHLVELNCQ